MSVSTYNTTGVVTKKTIIQIFAALRTSNLMSRTARIRKWMEGRKKKQRKLRWQRTITRKRRRRRIKQN